MCINWVPNFSLVSSSWSFHLQLLITLSQYFYISVFSLTVAGAVTIGLYFVVNAQQNLILSCIFEALTSLGISTVYCVMVDLFPTNLRYDFNSIKSNFFLCSSYNFEIFSESWLPLSVSRLDEVALCLGICSLAS